jgi:hypothetical protein
MLRPNRIANMNSGTNETIGTSPSTPSSDEPQPFGNTATTTP